MKNIFPYLVIFILGIALWERIVSQTKNPLIAPGVDYLLTDSYPSFAIFGNSNENNFREATRVLLVNAAQTAGRSALGFFIGGFLGIGVGLFIYCLSAGQMAARMLLGWIKSVPLFSLVPLFIFWFSGRESGIVSYVIIAVGLIITVATYEAAINVPKWFIWQAVLAGANRTSILRTVIIPAMIPELILTFRWVIGLNWAFTLGAEYLSSHSSGLGFLAYQSYLYTDIGKLIVLAMVYAVLGSLTLFCFDFAVKHFASHYFPLNQK